MEGIPVIGRALVLEDLQIMINPAATRTAIGGVAPKVMNPLTVEIWVRKNRTVKVYRHEEPYALIGTEAGDISIFMFVPTSALSIKFKDQYLQIIQKEKVDVESAKEKRS